MFASMVSRAHANIGHVRPRTRSHDQIVEKKKNFEHNASNVNENGHKNCINDF